MPSTFVRALGALGLLISAFCLLAGVARADLVWAPDTGWRIEGGVLSRLSGSDSSRALDLMNKARAAEERGSIHAALRGYGKVAKKYPTSVYAPEAYYRTGMLRLDRQQYYNAFEAFQHVVGVYPNTKRFDEVIGEEYRIASALLNGKRNHLWGLIPSFRNRQMAIGYFELILHNAPYSDYAPLALMNVAVGYLRLHEPEGALDAFDRMINLYPQSVLAPDAYLKLAETNAKMVDGPLYDQAATKEAITYFQDFMILFPNDPSVPEAAKGLDEVKQIFAESKMKIGDFYFLYRRNYVAAKVLYNEAITAYPDSAVAARAKKKLLAVDALAAGKPAPAGTMPKRKKRFWIF
jgi:outer membrane protein assembly factor BamD